MTTAGSLTRKVSRPSSTSRATRAWPLLERDLRGEGRLRPAEEGSQHLPGLVAVVVDRLLAEQDQPWLLPLGHGLEQLGHGQRLQLGRGLDEDGAVGPHRERRAQRLLALAGAQGDGDDLRGPALSLRRIASSQAISSNGFIDILTLAMSTPEPSALTRTLTL